LKQADGVGNDELAEFAAKSVGRELAGVARSRHIFGTRFMAAKASKLRRSIREPNSYALGGIIRELREQRGWSWGQLSDACGLSRQGLIFLESNERLASVETAERIAKAFGLKAANCWRWRSSGRRNGRPVAKSVTIVAWNLECQRI